MLVVFAVMGFYPDLYVLQVVYYSFCMVMFTAGLIYATSAVTVFFRDMKEVVAILVADWNVGDTDHVEFETCRAFQNGL